MRAASANQSASKKNMVFALDQVFVEVLRLVAVIEMAQLIHPAAVQRRAQQFVFFLKFIYRSHSALHLSTMSAQA